MMTSIARGTLYLFICLTLSVLGGCASVSKVTDWFAKSDDSSASQMTAKGGAATTAPQAPVVYQSQSAPAVPQQPATAGSVTSLEPNPSAQPVFSTGIAQVGSIPETGSSPQAVTTAAATGMVRGGNPAPTFAAKTMDGGAFDLSQHQGRVVLLDFWQTTCGPCLRAIPKVQSLRSQYGPDQLTILGVNCDRKLSAASSYIKSNPHPWPQVHAFSQSPNPTATYGVSLLPIFVVIDQIGAIQYKGNNITTAAAKVAELVGAPSLPQTAGAGFYTAQR